MQHRPEGARKRALAGAAFISGTPSACASASQATMMYALHRRAEWRLHHRRASGIGLVSAASSRVSSSPQHSVPARLRLLSLPSSFPVLSFLFLFLFSFPQLFSPFSHPFHVSAMRPVSDCRTVQTSKLSKFGHENNSPTRLL